jgi:thioredoxin reductase
MKVAIIGGGPLGVEAALYGACAGFDVQLFERGRLAENVRQWGHVGVFTEWQRNRSPLAVRLLQEQGVTLPPGESTSTGAELADYVMRLAALAPLRGRIMPQTPVLSLGRERCLKSDLIGDSGRAAWPFRLLLRTPGGEKVVYADAVIDATGVYATPNWIGNGGMPCPGEMALHKRIDYALPDVLGRDRARFANRHTLVVGSGHSAASTLRSIAELFEEFPQTRLTWVVRRDVPPHGFPYTLVLDDSSPHRDALHRRANELTTHSRVDFRPRTVVDAIKEHGKYFEVRLLGAQPEGDTTPATIECDNLVAHTGFRPDDTLWRELAVHVHPATGGPYRLSQALVDANHRAGVGLSTGYAEKKPRPADDEMTTEESQTAEAQTAKPQTAEPVVDRWKFSPDDPQLLWTGEPNFFVIGIKSYGRDAGFLMQNGFRQVRDVYRVISGDSMLDLYKGALDKEK